VVAARTWRAGSSSASAADVVYRCPVHIDGGDIGGLRVPGGPWVVSTSAILDSSGKEVGHTSWYQNCTNNESITEMPACLAKGNIHVVNPLGS
jgi:hypothetical protein